MDYPLEYLHEATRYLGALNLTEDGEPREEIEFIVSNGKRVFSSGFGSGSPLGDYLPYVLRNIFEYLDISPQEIHNREDAKPIRRGCDSPIIDG